jgi:type VI secretion system protein ImpC
MTLHESGFRAYLKQEQTTMPVEPAFGVLESAEIPFEAPGPGMPFRIALLGDFSGRANRGETGTGDDLADRRAPVVDAENLDDVMARLGVKLRLPLGDSGDRAEVCFAALDDFDPDRLYQNVERFLDLDGDEERGALMSALLHHPEFQALESVWRGVDWLLRRTRRDRPVELVLLDVSLDELTTDLRAGDDLAATGLYRLLIDKLVLGPKGKPWALLVGNYLFEPTLAHAELLGRLAKIARHAAAPFLAAAPARLADKSFKLEGDDAEAWEALRALPEAALIGLTANRFLLRLPYGESTRSIDRFAYEELPSALREKPYLWGCPALGCAALLVLAYTRNGWRFKPGMVMDLGDMPLHVYTGEDGDSEATLTESWLTTTTAEKVARLGLMALLPVRGRDSVQLAHFHALATGATSLPGRWEKGAGLSAAAPPKTPQLAVSVNTLAGPAAQGPAETPVDEAPAAAPDEPAAESESPPPEEPPAESESPPPEEPPAETEAPPADSSMTEPEPPASDQPPDSPPAEEAAVASTDTDAPAPAPEQEMDPELAALLKQLEENNG